MARYTIKCVKCGKEAEEKNATYCKKCGGPLEAKFDLKALKREVRKQDLRKKPFNTLRYEAFYPLKDQKAIISLKSGGTDILHVKRLGKELGLKNLYVKWEAENPTGSFKDRGTEVEMSKAFEEGAKSVVCASSGNMGASIAAYAAQAGIKCTVFVPEEVPIVKLSQIISYGSQVVKVAGGYDDAQELARITAERTGDFLLGDYVYRQEGQKSTGYEIADQFEWKSPDRIIVPMGVGTHISGIWKGFQEFHGIGYIDKKPKLIGVQAEGCCPVVKAFEGNGDVEEFKNANTIASAILVRKPFDGDKAISAIRESKGSALAVKDIDILHSLKLLARLEGLFTETASATTIAAARRMIMNGALDRDERIVCVLTASGLKDPERLLKGTIVPTIKDYKEYTGVRR